MPADDPERECLAPGPARRWRRVFRFKGAWNCAVTTAMLFLDAPIRARLGMPPADPLYRTLFLALAFAFGLGYWRVGGDPSRNREVVRMGVFGQCAVPALTAYYVLLGAVRWPYLLPAAVDALFAVLFVRFLRASQHPAPPTRAD